MSEEKRCAQCGAVLTADAPHGLCPACLLKRGFASSTGAGESNSQGARTEYVPPPAAELASFFPELEILGLIGRGGMGVVYKARQKRLDRLVALKILPSNVSRDAAFAERFSREAKALARLTHPNIVTVHDFGQTNGLFYFVMEFVDGMNLRQLLDTGKMAPKEALAIVPQICDALQYAHDKGIVHRDIKPENILIDKSGVVKIADFGLAKIVGLEAKDLTITSARDVIGTPLYMAPEQVEHPQDVDHRADIYSLGVVFYQILTGELPIGRFAPPSRKVQIDVRLDEVVLRALEKEPELRYQHASDVKTQVETIAMTPPSSGAPAPAPVKSLVSIIGQFMALGVSLLFACLLVLLGMSSDAIGSKTWGWFRLGFEFFAAAAVVGSLFVIYHAAKTRTPEARRTAKSAGLWMIVVVLGIIFGFWSPHLLKRTPTPLDVACQTIRNEVGRQLRESGASYDSLQVTVAEERDRGSPFAVSYRGLRHFKYALGGQTDPRWPASADGRFIMQYIGGGQWQGKLGDTQFTVQVGKVDNIALPFINDPDVIGEWKSVDFVSEKSAFDPHRPTWKGDLFLKGLTFLNDGKMTWPGATWTKGVVMSRDDRVASRYDIQEIDGQRYLFFEWKSGDVTILGRKPMYYVLRWSGAANAAMEDLGQTVAGLPSVAGVDQPLVKSDFIGQTWFPKGDSIEITSVERTKERMVVKGHYNLVSHDSALLALYITTTNAATGPEETRQRMQISKGAGYFDLVHTHLVPGLPHVSMYADGHPFAALYFGTKAEALEESKASWITNAPSGSAEAATVTFGPVIERVLDNAMALGSGRTGTSPLPVFGVAKGGKDRLLENIVTIEQAGWDVIQDSPDTILALGMKVLPLTPLQWDTLSPQQAVDEIERARVQVFVGFRPDANGSAGFPATYAFQTREGATGILQITGFTDNPHRARIRYKLVQPLTGK